MLEEVFECPLPPGGGHPQWHLLGDKVLAVRGSALHIMDGPGGEWGTVQLPGVITAVERWKDWILIGLDSGQLIGLNSGELLGISAQLQLTEPILIKEDRRIGRLQWDDSLLYLLVGDNLLVTLFLDAVEDAFLSNDTSRLKDSGCYYELPVERAITFHLSTDDRIDGWPEPTTTSGSTKLLVGGAAPMFSIVELPPIGEALLDPVSLAADFISNTVGGWLFKSQANISPKPRALLDRLPRGHVTTVMAFDDADRCIQDIQMLPKDRSVVVLLDQQHGRALLLDPYCGIIRRQVKGLRGSHVSLIADRLVALHPKRHYIDTHPLRGDGEPSRHDFPTDLICGGVFGGRVICLDPGKGTLIMYKFAI